MSESKKFYRPDSKRTMEFLLAKTMMVLVLVFLILNTPRLILGMIEVTQLSTVEECYEHGLDYHVSKQTYILDFLARFLVIVNSSVNFVIYCLVGSEFRAKLFTSLRIRSSGRRRMVSSRRKEISEEGRGEDISSDGLVSTRLNMDTTTGMCVHYLNR